MVQVWECRGGFEVTVIETFILYVAAGDFSWGHYPAGETQDGNNRFVGYFTIPGSLNVTISWLWSYRK